MFDHGAEQVRVAPGRLSRLVHLLLESLHLPPRWPVDQRPQQIPGSLGRRDGRLPLCRIPLRVGLGLAAQQRHLPQRQLQPRRLVAPLLPVHRRPGAADGHQPQQGGGQRQGEFSPFPLLLGPRVGLHPRQLGRAEPLLHAG